MEHVAIKTLSSPLAVVTIQVTVSVSVEKRAFIRRYRVMMGHENMSNVLE